MAMDGGLLWLAPVPRCAVVLRAKSEPWTFPTYALLCILLAQEPAHRLCESTRVKSQSTQKQVENSMLLLASPELLNVQDMNDNGGGPFA